MSRFLVYGPAIYVHRVDSFWTGLAFAVLLFEFFEWANWLKARNASRADGSPTTSVFYKAGRWFGARRSA